MPTHSRRALLGAGFAAAGSGLLAACSPGDGGTPAGPAVGNGPHGPHAAPHSPHATHGHHGAEGHHAAHDHGHSHSHRPAHHRSDDDPPSGYLSPDGPEVAEAERKRGLTGPVRRYTLTAAEARIDLGGRTVKTWAYDGELPGKEIRVTAGDRLHLTLNNHLPQSTSVHWHGLHVRNDMDGVPGVTQRAVRPGSSFDYRFVVGEPGTHWIHPHVGVQLDRALYAPLIVDDPKEPLSYDKEWVVLLDDWLDGIDGSTPDAVLDELTKGHPHGGMGHMGGMHAGESGRSHHRHRAHGRGARSASGAHGPSRLLMGGRSRLLGGEPGDVDHPFHLINGRLAEDPETFHARPGDRIRIRIINASGDTAYRVALGGHRMTVTHTDGYPVQHAGTDALLIGMAERYDVLVTAKDGVFPFTALAEGKHRRSAMAVLRTGSGARPGASTRPRQLYGRPMTAYQLTAAESVRASRRSPDRIIDMKLTGSMERYNWAINGRPYTPSQRYPVWQGERVRIVFRNHSRMWHPMHVHGHTFALPDGGPLKDTTILLPGRRVAVDFDADNPGLWMVHCHNVYHSESGMMTILGYRSSR
ncbi:multicopper oxidase family protein [Streptomyces lydicus]|uniref:multicopper oxidase family protein n=1 Tax=Streptomyces lydicus TaxID=47763 RepID=UPI00370284B3